MWRVARAVPRAALHAARVSPALSKPAVVAAAPAAAASARTLLPGSAVHVCGRAPARQLATWQRRQVPLAVPVRALPGARVTALAARAATPLVLPSLAPPLLHAAPPSRTLIPAVLARLGLAGAGAAASSGMLKRRGLAILVIGVGSYLLATSAVYVAESMFNVSFADVGILAFSLGVTLGVATTGGVVYLTRVMSIRPEPIYRLTLKRIRADPGVATAVGTQIKPDAFRAYSLVRDAESSGVLWRGMSRAVSLVVPDAGFYRRVQLVFQVTGRRDTGIVHADVRRVRGGYEYLNLSVHVPRTGTSVVLAGSGKPLTPGSGLMSISS